MNHSIVEYLWDRTVMTIRPAPAFTGLRDGMLKFLNQTLGKEPGMIHGFLVY